MFALPAFIAFSLALMIGISLDLNLVNGYYQGFVTPQVSTAFTPLPKPTLSYPSLDPIPTSKPTFTPTPTIHRLLTTPAPKIPTSTPPTTTNLSVKDDLINQINGYRQSQGLPEVRTDSYTCGFAATRAQEVATNFSHDGFNQRVNSQTLPYPSFSNVTENLAQAESEDTVIQMWINSPSHATNLKANVTFACVRKIGKFYAFEGWKP